MRYIEQNQNVTMEYEVVIDEEKLKSIINELNEKCSRVVKKDAKVTSSSIEEAMAKITSPNKTDISIKKYYIKIKIHIKKCFIINTIFF